MRTACVHIPRCLLTALISGLVVTGIPCQMQAQGQAIDVIGVHERGKIINGSKAGVWTYLNNADEVTLKIDLDKPEVVDFGPDTSKFLVSLNGSPWTPAKLSRPVMFPGRLYPLQRQFMQKVAPTMPRTVGVTWLQFVINKNGVATQPKVIKPRSPAQEKALLEFFAEMPKQWIAGMVDGQFVDCLMAARAEVVQEEPRAPAHENGREIFYYGRSLKVHRVKNLSELTFSRPKPSLSYDQEQFFWAQNDSVLTIKSGNSEWYTGFQFDITGKPIKRFVSANPFLFSCAAADCRELFINFQTEYGDYRNATYNTLTSSMVLNAERDDFLILPSPDKKNHLFGSRRNDKLSSYLKNVATDSIIQIPKSDLLMYGSWLNSDSILFAEGDKGIDSKGWMGRTFIYSVSTRQLTYAAWLQDHELVALSPDGKGALVREFDIDLKAKIRLKYYDFATGKSKRVLGAGVPLGNVFWSRDPDYIYYQIEKELYRKQLSTGDNEVILSNALMPRMNHSRTAIAYVNSNDANFYMCDPDGKSVRLIIAAPR